MRVVILGAGVIGVTTAYQLARDGHEVVVIERHDNPAEKTSFANAGLVAPGHAYAWSSPRAPKILLKSLIRDDQALRFKLSADPALWSWTLKFLAQCTNERAARNTRNKHRLCMFSQAALHEILADTGVAYDGAADGLLYLYRSTANFDRAVANMAILRDGGQDLRAVDGAEAARLDPALAHVGDDIAGAIHCPTDESGDAHLFTRGLAEVLAGRGVKFDYGVAVGGIELSAGRVEKIVTDQGDYRADAYVLALGCQAAAMARPLGVKLPVYPIKGYSVTLPIAGRNDAPRLGGVDEDNLVAYGRFGDRLRITATAEFAGYDTGHRPADFTTMLKVARGLFPNGGDYDQPRYWAGLRPMTPEGAPILGPGRHQNLYFNVGHGHMGWTMAAGSARIVADMVAGRSPEIDLDGLTVR